MNLACIINVWDGLELLKYAIQSTQSRVNLYIIVYQDKSNWGENYDPYPELKEITDAFPNKKFVWKRYEPFSDGGFFNERYKRNDGLEIAKQYNCTHFFFQDVDELYEDFESAVQSYLDAGKDGSVCEIYTYFKLPTLRFENPDKYFVPFIHKLMPETKAGTKDYPFYVDPTRSVNCDNVALLPIFMQHFSYIRHDIERKCRNSSARENFQRSTILHDYEVARPGYHVKDFFDQKLIEVPNQFGIEI